MVLATSYFLQWVQRAFFIQKWPLYTDLSFKPLLKGGFWIKILLFVQYGSNTFREQTQRESMKNGKRGQLSFDWVFIFLDVTAKEEWWSANKRRKKWGYIRSNVATLETMAFLQAKIEDFTLQHLRGLRQMSSIPLLTMLSFTFRLLRLTTFQQFIISS